MTPRAFLTAEWRHLAMLNYAVDPSVLQRFVPSGVELDSFQGTHYASMVGFRFQNVKIFGCAVPFHRNFDEVNLRFYVRRQTPEGWRRGVVFIRELVPKRAIAVVAHAFYGEPYIALPMRHQNELSTTGIRVKYEWRFQGNWQFVSAAAKGPAKPIEAGSLEEFITEHYWGYTAQKVIRAEYQVEHPRWDVWTASEARLDANVSELYGDTFRESLSSPPASAFIADGSLVVVRRQSAF